MEQEIRPDRLPTNRRARNSDHRGCLDVFRPKIVNGSVQGPADFRTVGLGDHNPETIAVNARRFGFKAFLGDPMPVRISCARPACATPKVLVVALTDPKSALQLIAYAVRNAPDLHICDPCP